jgi:hypothetical protein
MTRAGRFFCRSRAQYHALQGAEVIARFERMRRGCVELRLNTATLVTPYRSIAGAKLSHQR